MNTILMWIKASRPHTMGLSIAVVLVGSAQVGIANLHWDILFLSILASASFQLVSNFSNDYGDFKKGIDSHHGDNYIVTGKLSVKQIKNAVIILAIISIISVIILIWQSPVSILGKWIMFTLGIIAVIAAITYTLGKRPYGYYALGDVMVFLFFGLLGVIGSYYLQKGDLSQPSVWLLSVAFGVLSTSVLNINNMRDSKTDKSNNKITVANILRDYAINYQGILFVIVFALLISYALFTKLGVVMFLLAFCLIALLWKKLKYANKIKQRKYYNYCLALLVKITLLLSFTSFMIGLYS